MLDSPRESSISSKRKEIAAFLLAVVVISFFVSSLANVMFALFFQKHSLAYSLTIYLLLCSISFVAAYKLLLSETLRHSTRSKVVLIFSRKWKLFLFPDSSRAAWRINMKLREVDQKLLEETVHIKNMSEYHRSKFGEFMLHVSQQYILTSLLYPEFMFRGEQDRRSINPDHYPPGMIRNPFATSSAGTGHPIVLPRWMDLDVEGGKITLSSRFGTSKVWYGNRYFNEPPRFFLSAMNDPKSEYFCIMFDIDINTTYNPLRFYSKEMEQYDDWVRSVHEKLESLDRKRLEQNLPLFLLERLIAQTRPAKRTRKKKSKH